MTTAEADKLIATLPKPSGLRLYREGDWILMAGGTSGPHSIPVGPSSGQRLLTHWQGYVNNQGLSIEPMTAALAGLSSFARTVYDGLCETKTRSLLRGSIAKKLRVGRWKAYRWSDLGSALSELTNKGLVTSDNQDRYTAVCEES